MSNNLNNQEEKVKGTRNLMINIFLSGLISLIVFILGYYFFIMPHLIKLEVQIYQIKENIENISK